MLIIAYGMRTDSTLALLIKKAPDLAIEFMDLTSKCSCDGFFCKRTDHLSFKGPWANPIDFFTPLQWLPSKTKTQRHKLHDDLIDAYGNMILDVKAHSMDVGEDVPDCLVKTLLQTQEEEKLDWKDLCMLSAVFTLSGVSSVGFLQCVAWCRIDGFQTSGIISWFLAFIPSFPEVQERAHEELDRVVG